MKRAAEVRQARRGRPAALSGGQGAASTEVSRNVGGEPTVIAGGDGGSRRGMGPGAEPGAGRTRARSIAAESGWDRSCGRRPREGEET